MKTIPAIACSVALCAACHAATEAAMPTSGTSAFGPVGINGTPPSAAQYLAATAILTNNAPALAGRNWYVRFVTPSGQPPIALQRVVATLEVLTLREGVYSTARDMNEIINADSQICQALVARYRNGLGPTNLAARVTHSGEIIGRVSRIRHVRGEGVWATVELGDGVDPFALARMSASPELYALHHALKDEHGTWGSITLPWYLMGIAFTDNPALRDTRVVVVGVGEGLL